MKNRTDEIVDKMLEEIEKWDIPWKRKRNSLATNGNTGRPFRGGNQLILQTMTLAKWFTSNLRLTFNQIKALGWSVKAWQKWTLCQHFKMVRKERDNEGEKETYYYPKSTYFHEYNIDQSTLNSDKLDVTTLIETKLASDIRESFEWRPEVEYDPRPHYNPYTDSIGMPHFNMFDSEFEAYHTQFHEGGHSIAHPNRLNRESFNEPIVFWSPNYSFEELVAEIVAAMLCADANIDDHIIVNSAAYARWRLKVLKWDKSLLLKACSEAQKRYEYIIGNRESK